MVGLPKEIMYSSESHLFLRTQNTKILARYQPPLSRALSAKNSLQEFAGDRPIRKTDSESGSVIGQSVKNSWRKS